VLNFQKWTLGKPPPPYFPLQISVTNRSGHLLRLKRLANSDISHFTRKNPVVFDPMFRIRHNSRRGICVLSIFVDLQSSTGVKIDLHSITTDISPILVHIFDDMRSEASYATLTSFGIRNIYLDDYPRLFTSATDDYPRLFTSATEPADTLGDALRIFVLRFNVPNTCRLLRHYASRAVSGGSILPPMRHNSHSNTCAHGPCYSREPTSTGLCLLLINENTFITLAMHISPANSESNINYRYGADNNA